MFQTGHFVFGDVATEIAEADATSGVGSWRDQGTERHPFEMPVRLQAGQLSYVCLDWSLSPVSTADLPHQTKHNVVGIGI